MAESVKGRAVYNFGSARANLIAYGLTAMAFIGVARIEDVSRVAGSFKNAVAQMVHEPDAMERLQSGDVEVVYASSAEEAVANAFVEKFHGQDASGEFFLMSSDTVIAIACDDAPGNGGYDDESVVMRYLDPSFDANLFEAAQQVLAANQPVYDAGKTTYVLVADNTGAVDFSNALATQGGQYSGVRDVLVNGYDLPGKYYTGFRLYLNSEGLGPSAKNDVAPLGP